MNRLVKMRRETQETMVELELNLDGKGEHEVDTPYSMINHLIGSMARFSGFNIRLKAVNKVECDEHHLIEDIALTLGEALNKALGDKTGINRFGYSLTPMDEVLVGVSIDLSGRPFFAHNIEFDQTVIGNIGTSMVQHFLRSFSNSSGMTLHVIVFRNGDAHHLSEAVFKALGLSLKQAVSITGSSVPSEKGVLR
ncbi:MAG: imidazoleglycerol-phosphate dehydratase HisB [Crenarchaeota archaeon]|nr:imidazoleglycerol-phosphate dehydratase HisB [Thermoproteota archaeon]MDW8033500.1 imidazoleglycerol-phosphate dehydratase HisB [Nitrososphaerota archaeon]